MGLGIYLHIPFCRRKCAYCDFNSFPNQEDLIPSYLDALKREMSTSARGLKWDLHPVTSLYFGGGTPTVLSAEELTVLLDGCRRFFPLDPAAEITVEGNPEGLDQEKLTALREAGFNRLSLGVQSFDDRRLRQLGRGHGASQARKALAAARTAGFLNLSLDLIYSLPGQQLEHWEEDLHQALDFSPEHLSVYALTLEEGTPLFRQHQQGELALPEEDEQISMYRMAQAILTARGYRHYEISNFCLPGREARHNLLYWHNQEYLGLGAGAHSYLDGRRFFNREPIPEYIRAIVRQGTATAGGEHPTLCQQMGETVMLGLRLTAGLDLSAFARRYGRSLPEMYPRALEALIGQGLLNLQGERLKLTPKGMLLSNEVFAEFV